MENGRSGRMVRQQSNYSAFIPNPLPPDPPIRFDSSLIEALSKADRYLGRLDGLTQILPNPDLFVAMYVHKEAVLSSQIEGIQASFIDILDMDGQAHVETQDVEERLIRYACIPAVTLPAQADQSALQQNPTLNGGVDGVQ